MGVLLASLESIPEPNLDLYDALVSINVPSDKARALADAMEGYMDSILATKQDLRSLEQKMENHFRRIELNQSLETHKRSVNFWFGLMFFGGLGIMFALIWP